MSGPLLARLEDIPSAGEGPFRCSVDGEELGLFRVGEQVIAWRDLCPHEAAQVCRGTIAGTRLESDVGDYRFGRAREILRCPWHGWEFDLRTGHHLASGSGARLRSHPIEVRDGLVFDAAGLAHDRELVITGRHEVAEAVVVLDLSPADDAPLPAWAPGAHIDLELASGRRRQYSLCGDPRDRTSYRIAVLREVAGRGGSAEVHDDGQLGARLLMKRIRNRFPLVGASRYLFIAGGIGITAMLAMARSVSRRRGAAELVYVGRTSDAMPFRDEVAALGFARTIMTDADGRPDLTAMLAATGDETVIYCCGPTEMITQVAAAGERLGRRVVTESFTGPATPAHADDQDGRDFDVVLAGSGQRVTVGATETILEALRREGIGHAASSCEQGWCGSCETRVLEGAPQHRDTVLTDAEREESDRMMICVGRATGDCLTLDL
ncbi:2Fe-2S iron-sulfur cluster-binding protein [Occultella aeris]|uniref:Phthalate 4,5-dioxygenase oxygenase reductase subunit n=1 Tax=Occultella aeris TaxID=2761496 RepID=A0A7M4DLJ7_9MICO|nr:2Fe-2S iron-sulfur cluster-binding protein [Occultella aeris]VZO38157.1 Phthalate 4,5-dioxygenase oxygenase reductase subunit [Occultella aeris]